MDDSSTFFCSVVTLNPKPQDLALKPVFRVLGPRNFCGIRGFARGFGFSDGFRVLGGWFWMPLQNERPLRMAEALLNKNMPQGFLDPKGPCTQTVCSLALKYCLFKALFGYFGGQSVCYLGTWTLRVMLRSRSRRPYSSRSLKRLPGLKVKAASPSGNCAGCLFRRFRV